LVVVGGYRGTRSGFHPFAHFFSVCLNYGRWLYLFYNFLYEQHFTIHGLEVVATCIFGYVSKERWRKADRGYILDESYDHTKLPKIPCRELFKPLIPFSVVPGAKALFWLSVAQWRYL
jgi:hypothetical protein